MDTNIGRCGVVGAAAAVGLLSLAACQTTATNRIPAATGVVVTSPVTAEQLGAPRVLLQTEYESFGVRRVRTRLRLEEDAFVLVVNVAPDGMARVIFPETPEDNGLLRGGRSYVLPGFFSGYPSVALETQSTMTRFVQVSRSIYSSPRIRGPGYIFALASRSPFDMQRLEDEGFFDWVDFGNQLYELDPDQVIPAVAEVALWDVPNFIATTDVARYAGYDPSAGERMALAYASGRESVFCPTYTMTSGFMSGIFFSDYGHYYPQACLYRDPRLQQRFTGPVARPLPDSLRPNFPVDSSEPPAPIWRRQGADTTQGGRGPIWRRDRTDAIAPAGEARLITSESRRLQPFAPGRLQEDEIELTRETRERMLRRQRFPAGVRPRPTADGSRSTYEPGRSTRRPSTSGRVTPRDERTTRSRPTTEERPSRPAATESRPTRSEPAASPRPSASSSGSSSSGSSGSSSSGKRQTTP